MSWIKNIVEEVNSLKPDKKTIKKFPVIFGIILSLIYLYFLFFEGSSYNILLVTAIISGLAFLLPVRVIAPFYKMWMTIAVFLSYFMSRFILVVLFYFIVTPIGLLLRLFGKDFLDLKIDKAKKSYWNKREEGYESDPEKQY
ncbi:SxtJ family membrane protein [Melioribacter sp. Ez-97]|uniref:SxtJ family membrane protein n=1 Tax=Melioribacter sp. Ez-97 TaxID=3423434 RepID=UPI003ED871DE